MATVSFYDLLSNHPQTWWSANTYKVRFVLNYKRIPYMTIGVHFPDIAETSQKLGLEPVARGPKFTVPIVEYVGNAAMASEPAHIINTEIIIEVLRPYLSAMKPKM